MEPISTTALVLAVLSASYYALNPGGPKFQAGGCQRLDDYLRANVVGQELALQQLVAAVCERLEGTAQERPRPLIMSVHGPSGVGKTLTHHVMARALYSTDPESLYKCPGEGCPGYKVIYGLDFTEAERPDRLKALEKSLLEHALSARDPLIVFEEYDKLDCATRQWLRRFLEHAHDADASGRLSRAIILLESNLGYTELEQMLTAARGDASKLTPEAAATLLRDLLLKWWRPAKGGGHTTSRATCAEPFVDTVRFLSIIDFFLPYFPLTRRAIEEVITLELRRRAERLLQHKSVALVWDDKVVSALADKVDFAGLYPLEGAKQVNSVLTTYMSPAIRKCPDMRAHSLWGKWKAALGAKGKDAGAVRGVLRISVANGKFVAAYPMSAT